MGSIKDLFLDEEKLEKGHAVPVLGPDGKATGDTITVLYIHSDAAQARMVEAARAEYEAGNKVAENLPPHALARKYAYCLVSGWSFEEECTVENVQLLFKRYPRARGDILERATEARLFFTKPAESSSPGRKKKSS